MRTLYLFILIFSTLVVRAQTPKNVFDINLIKGKNNAFQAFGGVWEKGWKTTGVRNERIIIDAGYYVKNGILEVSFTAEEKPWKSAMEKINYAGLFQESKLSQDSVKTDIFYARTGSPVFKFSNIKAAGRQFDRGEYEPRVGDTTDWIIDGKTVHTIKFEWRDGIPIFHDSKGRKTIFPRDIVGSDTPIDSLRYIFLGSDKYTGLTVKGLKFLSVKLTDLGENVQSPPPLKLKVHQNNRSLMDENGKPVFLICETAWGLTRQLGRDDVDMYVAHRRAQRFNAIAFVAASPGDGRNYYGDQAFMYINNRADVTKPIVTPGSAINDTLAYDYWDHLDYIMEKIYKMGMYAIVLPNWGTAVTGNERGKPKPDGHAINISNAYQYSFWLGNRYKSYPNIIWMLGGDVSAVYDKYDYRDVFRKMAEGIADGINGKYSPDGTADYSNILMSYHPEKLMPQSSEWFHNDAWLTFNSIQDWPETILNHVEHDMKLTPTKPSWVFEGRYECYYRNNYKPEQWGEWQIRQQAWQTIFKGAFGHTYGHEYVFGFGKNNLDWKAQLNSSGSQSIKHLPKFLNYIDGNNAFNLVSDDSLITTNSGSAGRLSSDLIICSRNIKGGFAMFYTAGGRSVGVKISKIRGDKPLFAFWYNPKTGNWYVDGVETPYARPFMSNIPIGPQTAAIDFDPPGEPEFGNDWVLVLSHRAWF